MSREVFPKEHIEAAYALTALSQSHSNKSGLRGLNESAINPLISKNVGMKDKINGKSVISSLPEISHLQIDLGDDSVHRPSNKFDGPISPNGVIASEPFLESQLNNKNGRNVRKKTKSLKGKVHYNVGYSIKQIPRADAPVSSKHEKSINHSDLKKLNFHGLKNSSNYNNLSNDSKKESSSAIVEALSTKPASMVIVSVGNNSKIPLDLALKTKSVTKISNIQNGGVSDVSIQSASIMAFSNVYSSKSIPTANLRSLKRSKNKQIKIIQSLQHKSSDETIKPTKYQKNEVNSVPQSIPTHAIHAQHLSLSELTSQGIAITSKPTNMTIKNPLVLDPHQQFKNNREYISAQRNGIKSEEFSSTEHKSYPFPAHNTSPFNKETNERFYGVLFPNPIRSHTDAEKAYTKHKGIIQIDKFQNVSPDIKSEFQLQKNIELSEINTLDSDTMDSSETLNDTENIDRREDEVIFPVLPFKKRKVQDSTVMEKLSPDDHQSSEFKDDRVIKNSDQKGDQDIKQSIGHMLTWRMLMQSDVDGDTPLHIAVAKEDVKTVEKYLNAMCRYNFNVDVMNFSKLTPLHIAVVINQLICVRLLLKAGASVELTTDKGATSVHLAAKYGSSDLIKYIMTSRNAVKCLPLKDLDGYSPLHLAVNSGRTDVVSALLQFVTNINIKDGKSGRSPLFHATENGDEEMVKLLLQHRANSNSTNYAGSTPLIAASGRNYSNIAVCLVSYGAETKGYDFVDVSGRPLAPKTSASQGHSTGIGMTMLKRKLELVKKQTPSNTPSPDKEQAPDSSDISGHHLSPANVGEMDKSSKLCVEPSSKSYTNVPSIPDVLGPSVMKSDQTFNKEVINKVSLFGREGIRPSNLILLSNMPNQLTRGKFVRYQEDIQRSNSDSGIINNFADKHEIATKEKPTEFKAYMKTVKQAQDRTSFHQSYLLLPSSIPVVNEREHVTFGENVTRSIDKNVKAVFLPNVTNSFSSNVLYSSSNVCLERSFSSPASSLNGNEQTLTSKYQPKNGRHLIIDGEKNKTKNHCDIKLDNPTLMSSLATDKQTLDTSLTLCTYYNSVTTDHLCHIVSRMSSLKIMNSDVLRTVSEMVNLLSLTNYLCSYDLTISSAIDFLLKILNDTVLIIIEINKVLGLMYWNKFWNMNYLTYLKLIKTKLITVCTYLKSEIRLCLSQNRISVSLDASVFTYPLLQISSNGSSRISSKPTVVDHCPWSSQGHQKNRTELKQPTNSLQQICHSFVTKLINCHLRESNNQYQHLEAILIWVQR